MWCSASLACALMVCAVFWKDHGKSQEILMPMQIIINICTVIFHCTVAAQITEQPEDRTVPIGSNATFHCSGKEQPVWIIKTVGGVRYTSDRARYLRLLPMIGFFPQKDPDGKLHLTVQATVANNNTNISCRVFVNGVDLDFSSTAKLTVLGRLRLDLQHYFILETCMFSFASRRSGPYHTNTYKTANISIIMV